MASTFFLTHVPMLEPGEEGRVLFVFPWVKKARNGKSYDLTIEGTIKRESGHTFTVQKHSFPTKEAAEAAKEELSQAMMAALKNSR